MRGVLQNKNLPTFETYLFFLKKMLKNIFLLCGAMRCGRMY